MRLIALLACLCAIACTPATTAQAARYRLADASSLALVLPDGWSHERDAEEDDGLTILTRPAAGDLELRISPAVAGCFGCDEDDRLLARLVQEAATLTTDAVDLPMPPIKQIQGHVHGYYFTLAEPKVNQAEYRFVTYGLVSIDGLRVSFSVLSNSVSLGTVTECLEILKQARRTLAVSRPDHIRI